MREAAGDLRVQRGGESEAQVRVFGGGDGEECGGVDQVSAVFWVQFGEENSAQAFAFEGEECENSFE